MVSCGEVEHLRFVSGFNGFKPGGGATDLTLSIVLPPHSRHHILVVRSHSTKSAKGAESLTSPKSVLLQSASAPRKESFSELQATKMCHGEGRHGERGGVRDGKLYMKQLS